MLHKLMRLFATGLFLLAGLNFALSAELIEAGAVHGTWMKANSPYQINGDIQIEGGDTLLIEPGVRVEFLGHYRITVEGGLIARGTESDTIFFTKSDTNGLADWSSELGAWDGINLPNWDSHGEFAYCVIEFAKTNERTGMDQNYAPINKWAGSMEVTHCVFRHNHGYWAGGIMYQTGDLLLKNSLLIHNRAYYANGAGGLYLFSGTNSMVLNNRFISNKSPMRGGGLTVSNTGLNTVVKNNFISQNESGYGGGMRITSKSGPYIIQNIIVNNYASNRGGGISFSVSGKLLANNVICNNHADFGGGGIHIGSDLLEMYNNIIWGNSAGNGDGHNISANQSTVTVRNCILEGGSAGLGGDPASNEFSWENIYEEDPLIANPSPNPGKDYPSQPQDWKILYGSPCLNRGYNDFFRAEEHPLDFFGETRVEFGHRDIGVHEYHKDSLSLQGTYNNDQFWMADTVYILGDVSVDAQTYIPPGVVIQFQGYNTITFKDTVHAVGTPESPILFSISDTTGFMNIQNSGGRWDEIRFYSVKQTRLNHCRFEYGEGIIFHTCYDVEIDHCEFSMNMMEYELIYFFLGKKHMVSNCHIHSNRSYHTDLNAIKGAISTYATRDMVISNNWIFNNYIPALYSNTNFLDCFNNLIYNNIGGLKFVNGFEQHIVNNTITYNTAHEWGYNNSGGINYQAESGVIANNIIWGEGDESGIYIPGPVFEVSLFNNLLIDKLVANDTNVIQEGNILAGPDPGFLYPIEELGPSEIIEMADYSLHGLSHTINKGRQQLNGIVLPESDIAGNDRVNGGKVDMGAFEHTGQLPGIVEQPIGGTICEGDTKTFNVLMEDTDTLNYQWQKDGSNIPGATSSSYVIDSAVIGHSGNYRCRISNAYGTTNSDQVYLGVNLPAGILTQSEGGWVVPDQELTLDVAAIGSAPLSYQWYLNDSILSGSKLPELQINVSDSSREGRYACIVENSCGTDTSAAMEIYMAPQICMVTVSSFSGHNLVVWEKKTKAPILSYKIYRESEAAGIYDELSMVTGDELSILVDTAADPMVQAYLYKITAVDTSGEESDIGLCMPHKTIHLIASRDFQTNATQLQWDRYHGFDYQTYIIYKSMSGTNFDVAASLSANINSWTDPDISAADQFYRIAVTKPDPCIPTGGNRKETTGPYTHALSNLDDNKLLMGEIPPDSLMLDNHSITEENQPGDLVGRFFTSDQDSIDSFSYMFVPGEGDTNNHSFTLVGNLLLAAETYDYETKNRYHIRVRSTDIAGNTIEAPFRIEVVDINEATGVFTGMSEGLRARPNPFSHQTTIYFSNPGSEPVSLRIIDQTGRICRLVNDIRSSPYQLSRGDLDRGIYLIELSGQEILRMKLMIE